MGKTLIVGGGIDDYNFPKIGASLALDIDLFTTFVGFGLSCILVTFLALRTPAEFIIEKHLSMKNLAPLQRIASIGEMFKTRLGDLTFRSFRKRYGISLIFGTYNLTKKSKVVLSKETTPDMMIVDALVLSITVPSELYVSKYKDDVYLNISYINTIPISILPPKVLQRAVLLYLDSTIPPSKIDKAVKIASILEAERKELETPSGLKLIPIPYELFRYDDSKKSIEDVVKSYCWANKFLSNKQTLNRLKAND